MGKCMAQAKISFENWSIMNCHCLSVLHYIIIFIMMLSFLYIFTHLHRLEKYLNIEIESLKIKSALKSNEKSFKGFEKFLNFTFSSELIKNQIQNNFTEISLIMPSIKIA